ncbi:chemotaxis protein MotB (plasmid) [Paroceanicella profunda]|uniref:Chemotaxis protein MotB n=1 Tax=Paroceanicella profunda TaxID=2579971 RepID=A0A5B8G5T9_9RHOB|nr:flagellar motor protein MotB [Paroceanicella profunda]QDL94742.1 chemotaxis protein MotB [Paroceanicella profunda]
MAKGDNARPIIKRKKIVAGEGHHGGAWKVAYADFVTAMMAFFLLMWLLNATTEDQKKGLADYFSPSIPISRLSSGGDGLFAGKTVAADDELTESGIGAREDYRGDGTNDEKEPDRDYESADPSHEDQAFSAVQNLLRGDSGESDVEDELLTHISTRVTDEGLIIELVDREGPPLFGPGTAEPSVKMRALLDLVAEVGGLLQNPIAVEGHTDALPFAGTGYGNWELSTDRAQAARRLLESDGIASTRFRRITGHGASSPAVEDPLAPQNRRIAITFLRTDLERSKTP